MFHKSILQIQEELHYHKTQQEKLEQELYTLKSYEEFSSQAFDYVKETIEQIQDPKYLELFRESLLSLFPIFPIFPIFPNEPIYLEESVETNDYVEKINSYPIPAFIQNEKKEKTYYELTGQPDLRPTTYEDLSVNISYSSSGRAYIGFNDRQEAESFRERLTVPSMLDKGEIMYMYEWEVKFYCDREYLNQLVTKDTVNNFEKISPRVIYNRNDKIVYLGMTAKGRCDCYGQYLTDQLTVGEKYTVSNKPSIIKGEYKYELRITEISLSDAIHLANFNLQRDPDHPDNAKLLTDWRANKVREVPPAYKPSPRSIPLDKVQVGDIVTIDAAKVKEKQYKVLAQKDLDGVPHVEAICIYNKEMPALVNECSWFKEIYPVAAEDVCIAPQFFQGTAPQFCDREKEAEDVQICIPKKKPVIKKSEGLTEKDFPSYPYTEIPLTKVEFGDVITSTPHSRSAYIVKEHKGEFVLAECLYHKSLPARVGEEYSFSKIYLVEKADALQTA